MSIGVTIHDGNSDVHTVHVHVHVYENIYNLLYTCIYYIPVQRERQGK